MEAAANLILIVLEVFLVLLWIRAVADYDPNEHDDDEFDDWP